MPGGAYSALSGMQARLQSLDRIAADLANINTAGYKSERTTRFVAPRDFSAELEAAVDVSPGGTRTDVTPGSITNTGRSLDVAIDGQGYFAIQTAAGVRYTRSGNFTRRNDGVLATVDGDPVLDAQNKAIKLGTGALAIDASGVITAGDSPVGRIPVWRIDEQDLVRESGSRFTIATNMKPQPSDAVLVPDSLEQANVTPVDRMIMLTEVTRSFEALQKGISVLMNDVDSRAISELGKR
jgi:flagellar basal-body rod protein FlgF/flagellar basal-body rod protein FlgG